MPEEQIVQPAEGLKRSSDAIDSPNSDSRLSLNGPLSQFLPTTNKSSESSGGSGSRLSQLLDAAHSFREIFRRNDSSFDSEDLDDIAWRTFSELMMEKEFEGLRLDMGRRTLCNQLVFRYIDKHEMRFIDNLKKAVEIPSISAWSSRRPESVAMVDLVIERLKDLGFQVFIHTAEMINDKKGMKLRIPPIIFAQKGTNPEKNTLLIYGHLDVHPASKDDGWDTEPFQLVEKDGKLYGRGTSDDKGPIVAWFNAIESYVKQNICLPVNVKFILESMQEKGSIGLEKLLKKSRDTFLQNVDLVTVSDNYWIGTSKPCLTYGLRGITYFFVEVEGGEQDLHSGIFGGTVIEAMSDLIWLLNKLTNRDGDLTIPHIMDDVCPIALEETYLYDKCEFDMENFKNESGVYELRFEDDKPAMLMQRWRYPSLSIHGIQGAFHEPGTKTIIPRKVIGKFSIRLVPNQTPDTVERLVVEYMKKLWAQRKSPNKMKVYMVGGGVAPYCANPFHPLFIAARQAIYWAHESIPDMIRLGGSVKRINLIQELTGKNVLIFPMGSSDDNAHLPNEKINRSNYMKGTKVFASYLEELGKVRKGDL